MKNIKRSYYESIYEPVCQYREICIDKYTKCSTCRHNKKSFWELNPMFPYSFIWHTDINDI